MKKLIKIFIIFILLLFIHIVFAVNSNKINNKKFKLDGIEYINKFDNKYIVMNKEFIYLYSDSYEEIDKISRENICKKKNNYDIIYRQDEFMYIDSYYKDNELVIDYRDILECEVIKSITLGG